MSAPRRIFAIADFRDHLAASTEIGRYLWLKGLIRIGHDVRRFSYRDVVFQNAPFRGGLSRWIGRKRADALLVQQLRMYDPHIILVLTMKTIRAETIGRIRDTCPHAVLVGREFDAFPDRFPRRLALARQMDIVVCTSAGRWLQTFKDAGVPCCAFMPFACDPDLHRRYDVADCWKTDIVFTGKVEHDNMPPGDGRMDLLRRLSKMTNVRLYGAFGNAPVYGMDYLYAINGAKIGLSINLVNDERMHHSDRPVHYVACGTFTLMKHVPGSELLFEDGTHTKYFETADEFFELADWYLRHDAEREKIAQAGMERAHREFRCERMAGHLMDLIEEGRIDAPWAEII